MAKKCTKQLIETVRILLERGNTWSDIAKVIGFCRRTLELWRSPESKYFNKDFADMVAAAEEEYASGRVKAGQKVQAVKHKLCTHELRPFGPKKPPISYRKKLLVRYANEVLNPLIRSRNKKTTRKKIHLLKLNIKMPKCDLLYNIERAVELLSGEKMEKVREQEVDPNQAAVKNVLSNTGKKENRWDFKQDLVHEVEPKTIADIAAAMGIGIDSGN